MNKVAFEDKRLKGAEFGEFKASGKSPTGSVPALEVDGLVLTQSNSQIRYAAKLGEAKLYPADPLTAFRADEIMDLCEDAINTIIPSFGIKDEAERIAARQVLVAEGGSLRKFVAVLSKRYAENEGDYFVGDSLTIADLKAGRFLEMLVSGQLDGVEKDFLEKNFPELNTGKDKIVAKIAELSA